MAACSMASFSVDLDFLERGMVMVKGLCRRSVKIKCTRSPPVRDHPLDTYAHLPARSENGFMLLLRTELPTDAFDDELTRLSGNVSPRHAKCVKGGSKRYLFKVNTNDSVMANSPVI